MISREDLAFVHPLLPRPLYLPPTDNELPVYSYLSVCSDGEPPQSNMLPTYQKVSYVPVDKGTESIQSGGDTRGCTLEFWAREGSGTWWDAILEPKAEETSWRSHSNKPPNGICCTTTRFPSTSAYDIKCLSKIFGVCVIRSIYSPGTFWINQS